jgi:UPF0755 protein
VIRRLLLTGFVLCAIAAAGATALALQWLSPAADSAPEVIFVVERGDSLAAVARKLEREGLVRNARAVEWIARLRGLAPRLQAGEFRVSAALPPLELLERIATGRVATYEVVLPEGLTAVEIGERLAAAQLVDDREFQAAVRDASLAAELGIQAEGLEGYLFPETYRLPRGLSGGEVARVMVEQFNRAWRQIDEDARRRGLEKHEVVMLASIFEKETGAAQERPLIASVFANRLERGMRLESDPTTIYGISDFDGNLRRRDLDDADNPYNTYRHAGLPPGPISNPGLHALRAVVHPAESDYLFFVSRNDGTHVFSATYREHVNAVNRYQRRRSTR